MNKNIDNLICRYRDRDNKFATNIDAQLLPIVIYGLEKDILELIDYCLLNDIDLKDSCSIIAYLREREDISFVVIQSLLASGVDPNNHFYSDIAIHQLYNLGMLEEYVDLLCKYKANLNIIDDNGCTVIDKATGKSDIKTIRLLIDKGASVLIQNNYGYTALASLKADIVDAKNFDENHMVTDVQNQIIELLDKTARKEMDRLGLLTLKQAAIQNWRCDYFDSTR